MRPKPRRGFVLLTLLGALALAAAVARLAASEASDGSSAARNRVAAERALWAAVGCANRVKANADSLLQAAVASLARRELLNDFARRLADAELEASSGCRVSAEPVGTKLDVNNATREQWRRLVFQFTRERNLDSLINAVKGLEDIRGIEASAEVSAIPGLSHMLGVERGPVSLRFAPREVLMSLPGMSLTAVESIIRLRSRDSLPNELIGLLGMLPKGASDTLLASFPELSTAATIDPVAWTIVAEASNGRPAITATIELLVSIRGRVVMQRERRRW